jgi:hypothetical protein
MRQRVNWPLVLLLSILGVGGVLGALALDDWTREAWSSVLIEAGAALALLSALVLLEQRIVRNVAESTARTEAQRVTDELENRVRRLEELDSAQNERHAERRSAAHRQLRAIRDGAIWHSSVGELLVEGVRDRLFDGDSFHVRTSDDPECPVLYMLPFIDSQRVIAVYLDFEPMELSSDPILLDGEPVPVPKKSESTVMWMDDDAAHIGAELLVGLERRNIPSRGFGFGYAVDRLLKSVEVMRLARAAPAGSAARLQGQLRVLINDDWAYTSEGLEAVSAETILPIKAAGWVEGRRWVVSYMFLSDDDRAAAPARLAEALDWIAGREGIRILPPGTDPLATFGRSRR